VIGCGDQSSMDNASQVDRLAPCPASPNCVSTEATDQRHSIAPFKLTNTGSETWAEIRSAVLSLPRTKITAEREHYLHAECRSAVLGFVDDLEVQMHPPKNLLALRSASRMGHYDFGANRRRAEKLRQILKDRGLVGDRSSD